MASMTLEKNIGIFLEHKEECFDLYSTEIYEKFGKFIKNTPCATVISN